MLRLATLLLAISQTFPLLAGTVTVRLENSRNECTVVNLPAWTAALLPAGSYPSEWAALLREGSTDLAFRALEGGVLVGLFVSPRISLSAHTQIYSSDKYAIHLPDGRFRKATQDEWKSPAAYTLVRDWKLLPGITTQPDSHVSYKGREFGKTGAKWPEGTAQAVRLSADGKYLAVDSWDGVNFPGGDLSEILFGPRARIKGNYYVDIYDTDSGETVALKGHFHDIVLDKLFDRSAWVSNRYYVLPLDSERMNRFVWCDMSRAAGAPPGKRK